MAEEKAQREWDQFLQKVRELLATHDTVSFAEGVESLVRNHPNIRSDSMYVQLAIHAIFQSNTAAVKSLLDTRNFPQAYKHLFVDIPLSSLHKTQMIKALEAHNDNLDLIHGAVQNNNLFFLKEIIQHWKLSRSAYEYGMSAGHTALFIIHGTILSRAVRRNNPELIRELIKAGLKLDDPVSISPCQTPIQHTYIPRSSISVLEFAIFFGWGLAAKELIRQGAAFPKKLAFSECFVDVGKACGVFEELLCSGLSPNKIVTTYDARVVTGQRTILALAIHHGNYDVAKLAFESGGRTTEPSVEQALKSLKEQEPNEANQRLLNLFYNGEDLPKYHSAYIRSLIPSSPPFLESHTPLPRDLHPLILDYAQPLPEEVYESADRKQKSLVTDLKLCALDMSLPPHFQSLIDILDEHVVGKDKLDMLITTKVADYAATFTPERLHHQNSVKWFWNNRVLPFEQFQETSFFEALKGIAGAKAIEAALERGIHALSVKGEDDIEKKLTPEDKRRSPII